MSMRLTGLVSAVLILLSTSLAINTAFVTNAYAVKQHHFSAPVALAFDSTNKSIYVANAGSDSVSVIHGGKVVANISVGSSPVAMAFDSKNNYIFVANAASKDISIIAGDNNTVIKNIQLPDVHWPKSDPYPFTPISLAFNPKNGDTYVLADRNCCDSYRMDVVFIIDGESHELAGSIDLPMGFIPSTLTLDSKTGYIYVAGRGQYTPESTIEVINGATNKIIRDISNTNSIGFADPRAIAIDTKTKEIYVANIVHNYVTDNIRVINAKTGAEIKTIPVSSSPSGLLYDSKNGYIYAATSDSNNVAVIDSTTHEIVKTIDVGSSPRALTFNSGNGKLYVANYDSDSVSVINGTTNTVIRTIY